MLKPLSDTQIESLNRRDLIAIVKGEQCIRAEYEKFLAELEARAEEKQKLADMLTERVMLIEGQICRIRSRIFDKKSERSPKDKEKSDSNQDKPKAKRGAVNRLPSDRYPNAKIVEKEITLEQPPQCKCCQKTMQDSGMTETSEHLTVTPKQYVITREKRHKYRCSSCHGDIVTAPAIPRIVPGGVYSDDMVIDATLTKFCDLIPIERYCQMAKRQGFSRLPPQSLIAGSFKLATFMEAA